jgi:hypothetical protein
LSDGAMTRKTMTDAPFNLLPSGEESSPSEGGLSP